MYEMLTRYCKVIIAKFKKKIVYAHMSYVYLLLKIAFARVCMLVL